MMVCGLLGSAVLENPRVGLVQDKAYQGKIVTSETGRLFPDIAIAVEANDGDAVAVAGAGSPSPDAGHDQANSDFLDGACHGILR